MIYNQLEFKPKDNEQYYYIDFNNNKVICDVYRETISEYYSADDVINGINFATNNCFKTRELAEEYLEMHNEIERLKREYPVNWNDCYEAKYCFNFDHSFKYFDVSKLFFSQYQGAIYVSDRDVLEAFIDKHKKAIKKFICCVEEEPLFYMRLKGDFLNKENKYIIRKRKFNNILMGYKIDDDDHQGKFTKQEAKDLIKEKGLVRKSIFLEEVK